MDRYKLPEHIKERQMQATKRRFEKCLPTPKSKLAKKGFLLQLAVGVALMAWAAWRVLKH